MSKIRIYPIILVGVLSCGCYVEREQDDSSSISSEVSEPHIRITTKSSIEDDCSDLQFDPLFILLQFTDWKDGAPVLLISQSTAEELGIDSTTYLQYVENLTR
jgi:hypothetical protein